MNRHFTLITILFLSLACLAQTHDSPQRLRQGNQGIMILGDSCNVRAMSCYNGGSESLADYAAVANHYYRHFDGKVNVYCMPIPTAAAIYGTDLTTHLTRSQDKAIASCMKALAPGVKGVEILQTLRDHSAEGIYSRTDHHWAPLGAYYAAQQLAQAAGLPFKDLSHYDKRVVHNFVGTMYKWSGCKDIKENPEDFIYYVPRDVQYTTTYIEYTLDKARRNVVKASEPHQGNFFWKYDDGSGMAYCTFMGGDYKLTQVKTSTHNGRRLVILKDSFGNALPGYLFYSFEEIHVIDCRYFTLNLTDYVGEHHITDIVMANNMGHAATARTTKYYRNYLAQ